jgi:endo-1,4-beta-xylanase
MRGHTLIWAALGSHNPDFVLNETDADVLEDFMLDYINKTITAVGDYPFNWDVVNEAVSDNKNTQSLKDSPWNMIDDFICKAFKQARAVAPSTTKLYYNDYKHASMTGPYQVKSDKIYEMISLMKERGEDECPIDGVGF